MVKHIIFAILMFVFCQNVFANYEVDLDRLEKQKYGQLYNDESISQRLERLERDYFGLEQSGDIEHRINMLNKMNINSYSNSIVEPLEQTYEKKSGIKNFWNNIKSNFTDYGTITGFTPPITSYGYTTDYYTNNPYRYNNYLNRHNNFCPYHNNRYFNNNFNKHWHRPIHNYHNRISNHYPHNFINSPFNNRIQPRTHAYVNPHNYYNNYYHNRIPTNTYTNFSTRSQVRILND